MSSIRPGVLALQGSSALHLERFKQMGLDPVRVKTITDLALVTHLVIPGGESTTIAHLIDLFGLRAEIVRRFRAGRLAIFGTCAGAILLAQDDGMRPERLALMQVWVQRNAYGSQVDSFARTLVIDALGGAPMHAMFIRAPIIDRIGDGVEVLARLDGQPVLVRAPGLLAATFHPELTLDTRVHALFMQMNPAAVMAA